MCFLLQFSLLAVRVRGLMHKQPLQVSFPGGLGLLSCSTLCFCRDPILRPFVWVLLEKERIGFVAVPLLTIKALIAASKVMGRTVTRW